MVWLKKLVTSMVITVMALLAIGAVVSGVCIIVNFAVSMITEHTAAVLLSAVFAIVGGTCWWVVHKELYGTY